MKILIKIKQMYITKMYLKGIHKIKKELKSYNDIIGMEDTRIGDLKLNLKDCEDHIEVINHTLETSIHSYSSSDEKDISRLIREKLHLEHERNKIKVMLQNVEAYSEKIQTMEQSLNNKLKDLEFARDNFKQSINYNNLSTDYLKLQDILHNVDSDKKLLTENSRLNDENLLNEVKISLDTEDDVSEIEVQEILQDLISYRSR